MKFRERDPHFTLKFTRFWIPPQHTNCCEGCRKSGEMKGRRQEALTAFNTICCCWRRVYPWEWFNFDCLHNIALSRNCRSTIPRFHIKPKRISTTRIMLTTDKRNSLLDVINSCRFLLLSNLKSWRTMEKFDIEMTFPADEEWDYNFRNWFISVNWDNYCEKLNSPGQKLENVRASRNMIYSNLV